MSHPVGVLQINTLRLLVHMGLTPQERENTQPVEVDLKIYFDHLPDCCVDDESPEFICYDEICSACSEYVEDNEFRFLEFLTMQLHRVVREHLAARFSESAEAMSIWIKLRKCNPPVVNLEQGAAFVYSDHPELTGL